MPPIHPPPRKSHLRQIASPMSKKGSMLPTRDNMCGAVRSVDEGSGLLRKSLVKTNATKDGIHHKEDGTSEHISLRRVSGFIIRLFTSTEARVCGSCSSRVPCYHDESTAGFGPECLRVRARRGVWKRVSVWLSFPVRVCGESLSSMEGAGIISKSEGACCRTALQYGEADIGGQDFSGQVSIAGCLPVATVLYCTGTCVSIPIQYKCMG